MPRTSPVADHLNSRGPLGIPPSVQHRMDRDARGSGWVPSWHVWPVFHLWVLRCLHFTVPKALLLLKPALADAQTTLADSLAGAGPGASGSVPWWQVTDPSSWPQKGQLLSLPSGPGMVLAPDTWQFPPRCRQAGGAASPTLALPVSSSVLG